MMHWLLPLSFYFFTAIFSFLLRRSLAKEFIHHNRLINAIFFGLFLLPTGLIASRFFPNNLDIGWANILLLVSGSLIWPIANIVAFRANHKLDVGVFSIISNLAPISTVSIALIFLNEQLTVLQSVGIGLLVISGVVVAIPLLNRNSSFTGREIMIGLLAAILIGIGISYERFMLTRIDLGAYLVIGWGSQVLWGVILAAKEYKYLPKIWADAKLRNPILLLGLTSALRAIGFVTALSLAGASVVGPAANFLSVLIVIAGYFVLKEKDHLLNKLLGVAIGIAGLILISS